VDLVKVKHAAPLARNLAELKGGKTRLGAARLELHLMQDIMQRYQPMDLFVSGNF
jgi:hypothetical protein